MKLLARLLKGTPVTPRRTETPEWHPLDELDADYPDKPWLDPATYEPLAAQARAELDDDPVHEAGSSCECPNVAPAKCTAPTKTGRPCSKPPRPGTDRCTLPAHQRT